MKMVATGLKKIERKNDKEKECTRGRINNELR